MIIKSIKMKGFKCFKDECFIEFNKERTIIEADNFQGKTSIGEAICWCLLGTNLFGNDKTINIINNNSRTAYCELKFVDNNLIEHTLIRMKGAENIVLLDGKKVNAEILSQYYYNKKVFLSIYNPYYFSALEPKEQRDLLRQILPTIDYRDAFNLLSQNEREILVEPRIDLNGFIKNARQELKELEKEQENLEGKKQYANSIINLEIGEEQKFYHEGMLMALKQEYECALKSCSTDERKNIESKLAVIDESINDNMKSLDNLRKQYKESKEVIENIRKRASICPVCNSKVNEKKSNEIIENQTKILATIIKNAKENESRLNELQNQRKVLNKQYIDLDSNNKKEKLIIELREKISRLVLEKENIQKNNYEVKTKKMSLEKSKKDMETIDKALNEVIATQLILKNQITTAISLNYLIIRQQMDMVKEHLNKVEIVFSKVDKDTGEIKDDYKVFYEGKEYNVLSLSEKIRAVLEISRLINNVVGLNIPTFIDNSESITHYDSNFDNQLILAKVVERENLKLIV